MILNSENSISQRINSLLNESGLSQTELAEKSKVDASTIYRIIENITKKPKSENLKKLSDFFQVNENWLRTGKGEKDKLDNNQACSDVNTSVHNTSINPNQTIMELQKSNELQQKYIERLEKENERLWESIRYYQALNTPNPETLNKQTNLGS